MEDVAKIRENYAPLENVETIHDIEQGICLDISPTDFVKKAMSTNVKELGGSINLTSDLDVTASQREQGQQKEIKRSDRDDLVKIINRTGSEGENDHNKESSHKIEEVYQSKEGSELGSVSAPDKNMHKDITEVENDLLFSTVVTGREKNSHIAEEQSQGLLPSLIVAEAEFITPSTKEHMGRSKFWQTPGDQTPSPFTPDMDQTVVWVKDRTLEEATVRDVQHFLSQDLIPPFEQEDLNEDDNELEQLSEDLIKVFNFDSIENTSDDDKAKLIQKIIKLGGKDYTAEDLRRDIIRIEAEDEMWRQTCTQGKTLREGQDMHNTYLDQNYSRNQREEELEELTVKLYKELETEELNDNRNSILISPQDHITVQ